MNIALNWEEIMVANDFVRELFEFVDYFVETKNKTNLKK